MGRAKTTTMKYSETEKKKRNLAYRNKKLILIKKAYQLSVLCNVPTCIIIYPYKDKNFDQIQQQQQIVEEEEAEVFAFEGGDKTRPINDSDLATVSKLAREIVGRYLDYPNKNNKRAGFDGDFADDDQVQVVPMIADDKFGGSKLL